MRAFTHNDGYYEHNGDDIPAWAIGMTPCEVMPSAPINHVEESLATIARLEQQIAEIRAQL